MTAPNEHLLPACWKMDRARECKLIANRYAVQYKRARNMKAEEQEGEGLKRGGGRGEGRGMGGWGDGRGMGGGRLGGGEEK